MIAHLVGKYKFDVNADNSCGGLNVQTIGSGPSGSPLNYAVSNSNLPVVETLLKYGAEVGDCPGIAIAKQDAQSLKVLVDYGADPSETLDTAVCMDFVDGCKLCLQYGADIALVEARDREMPPNRSLRGAGTNARRALHIQPATGLLSLVGSLVGQKSSHWM